MTREEDLIRIGKKLDKMVSRNTMDGALDLLKELKNFNMTLKLLQETRIGMSVNSIRKHCSDEEAIALAKTLIKDWKRLLEAENNGRSQEENHGLVPEKEESPSHSHSRRLDFNDDSDKDHKPRKEKLEQKPKEASRPPIKLEKHGDGVETHRPKPSERQHREKTCEEQRNEQRTTKTEERKHCDVSRRHSSTDDKRNRPVELHRPLFERRSVLDSSILYPSRYPSPPRLARAPLPVKTIKRPSQDSKKARKDSKESQKQSQKQSQKHSHSEVSKSTSPTIKRPSLEIKRKFPIDPNAPIAPLPLHLHPPARKENPDPNAPLGPLPLHLHPPPAPKRPTAEVKKARKESTEGKVSTKHSEAKRNRVESIDKKPAEDVKKELQRRNSVEKKPSHPQKRPSFDSKADRRESTDTKRSSSPPAKKLSSERRESAGFKAQSAAPHRKPSTDSSDSRKSKGDVRKTPTTPTSPLSPGFGGSGGPLSPQHSTGDSVRDKCIGMIAAALRTDNDYIEFGVNCDRTAVEIEDHIYQEIKATDMKYKNRVRSRMSNLKDPKNPGLRKNVLAGNIELSRFASMSAEEMASDELKQLRNVLTQEAIREHQMAKTGGTSTDLLQCDKCKKRNCTYNQVQTRSADEPMTTFVLCNECGNRWKFC